MQNKLLLYLTIFITIVWMVIIYSFSSAPSDESNSGSKGIIRYFVQRLNSDKSSIEIEKEVIKLNKPLRKVAHGSVYFILANFLNGVICVIKKNKLKFCNMISLIICFIYASLDEFHQTFSVGRTGQISDVFIDFFGAILGCLVFNHFYKKIKSQIHLID